MMQRKAYSLQQNEVFFIVAAIAAHSSFDQAGFRQKDIRFLIEMFSNWIDIEFKDRVLAVHNTQIMRYLEQLVTEGDAKRMSREKQPRYRLTRSGLVNLLSKLAYREPGFPLEQFYYVYHFLEAYRGPLEALIQSEGNQFPPALKIEMDSILDVSKLLRAQVEFVENALQLLRKRVEENKAVIEIIREGRKQKKSVAEIVHEIEVKYPYDLNSQKPLSEFYEEMPLKMREFVLDIAIPKRTHQIWMPMLQILEKHLEILRTMREATAPSKKTSKEI